MTDEERDSTTPQVRTFMGEFAGWISRYFPHHAAAIRQELGKSKMSSDRWNRIACLLSSLQCLPGPAMSQEEKDVRAEALSGVVIAQKMAAASLGCTRDPDACLDFAAYMTERTRKRIAQV